METKVCKVCGRELPVESFYKNGWGYTSICSECHTKRSLEGKEEKKRLKQQAVDALNARNLRLHDFQPRELMQELARRGYKGKLTYTQVQEIDLSNF